MKEEEEKINPNQIRSNPSKNSLQTQLKINQKQNQLETKLNEKPIQKTQINLSRSYHHHCHGGLGGVLATAIREKVKMSEGEGVLVHGGLGGERESSVQKI